MTVDFFQACQQGDVAAVRQQLEQNPALANAHGTCASQLTPDDTKGSPLTLAAQAGHTEVVRELLAHSMSHDTHTDADARLAQAQVTSTDTNAEALSVLREAALHADTRLANGAAPHGQKSDAHEGNTNANLPPPEVARMIPCRFFPNCRYGDRCLFFHPTGPMMAPPQGAQPMFFPGPNGMPFSPAPGAYGVPPPQFMDMNHPMIPMHYGPNGMPLYPQQPVPAPEAGVEPNGEQAAAQPAAQPEASGTDTEMDALANSMDTLGSSHMDADTASTNAPRAGRATNKNKSGNKGRNDSTNGAQRNRSNNGSRPSCAFFARSACRYGNDCRFPHILPDGTDARTLPNEDGKTKGNAPRRAQNASTERASTDSPDSPTAGAAGAKKSNPRNARTAGTNSTRGKGARRGTAPAPNRKTVQRVPNSDEFPALPGGAPGAARPDTAGENNSAENNAENKPKANFSAILSAPAPPKPAKAPKAEGEEAAKPAATAPAPAAAEQEPAEQHAPSPQQTSSATASPRDFATVAAAQSNAVTA